MKKTGTVITLIVALVILNGGLFFWYMNDRESDRQEEGRISSAADTAGRELGYLAGRAANIAGGVSVKEEKTEDDPAKHIYAHRDVAGEMKEHSFEAYDKAIKEGAGYIEQDVVISKDHTLYLSHDTSPKRMTGSSGTFSSMSDVEIDQLRTKAGDPILKLDEVFTAYGDTINYIVELKTMDFNTADAFADLVRKHGLEDRITLECFELEVLKEVEKTYPDMEKMYLVKYADRLEAGLDKDYVDIISIRDALMTEENRDRILRSGKRFSAWTLNSEEWIRKGIEMGVETYFTDEVAKAIELEKEYRKNDRQKD